jgi:hypothetical protein
MVPLIVAGAVAAGGAIAKGIRARKQRREAAKIDTTRPILERSRASIENEQNARQAAGSTRLPGQSIAENAIGAQTARATNSIQQTGGSTGEIINGLTNIDQNARNAGNDLAFQGAQLNQQNKSALTNVLNNVAEEEKEIWDYNKNQPFQTNSLRKQALLDASARNSDAAIQEIQDGAKNMATSYQYGKALNGGGGGSSAPMGSMAFDIEEGNRRARKGFGVKAGRI